MAGVTKRAVTPPPIPPPAEKFPEETEGIIIQFIPHLSAPGLLLAYINLVPA